MLRLFLRSIAINLLCIYLSAQILSGVFIYIGGYQTLLLAAFFIALVNLTVKPLVNILLLPIHLVTLGLFRWVTNLITLYLVTRFIPQISVHPFDFPGLSLNYLMVPPIHFSAFGAFVLTTLVLTFTFHFVYWLLQD